MSNTREPVRGDDFDSYDLFCELNACSECGGDGVIPCDGYGEHTCSRCDGSGVDPEAEYDGPDPI